MVGKKDLPQEEHVVTEEDTVNSAGAESNDLETEDVDIPKHNELGEVSEETLYTPITFSDEAYLNMTNLLAGNPARFVGEYYNSQIGEPLDSDEQLKIRLETQTSAVKYLTSVFFYNITETLHEGEIADLMVVCSSI